MDGTFSGVKARQREASTITAAIVEHMALEVACIAASRDFERAPAARKLFGTVERTQVPTGNADTDAAIVDVLRTLHWKMLGVAHDDPAGDEDVAEALTLLIAAHDDGVAAIAAGTEPAQLLRPCAASVDLATATAVSANDDDGNYMVRAWQAVLAAMMMDPRFVLEN
jgi:hypothetical protein